MSAEWAAECYFCGRLIRADTAENLLRHAMSRHTCRQGRAATGTMRPTITNIREDNRA